MRATFRASILATLLLGAAALANAAACTLTSPTIKPDATLTDAVSEIPAVCAPAATANADLAADVAPLSAHRVPDASAVDFPAAGAGHQPPTF